MNEIIIIPNKSITTSNAPPSFARKQAKYWMPDYINERLELIDNHMHKMLFFTMWRTGLRVSEIIELEKQDLNFKEYLISAKWLKSRKYKRRILPMHPELRLVLQTYTATMNVTDKLFPMARQWVYVLCERFFDGNPHMFRHSFAVNWLRNKGDIYLLKKMLGHSSIRTTEQYLDIVPQDVGAELLKVNF